MKKLLKSFSLLLFGLIVFPQISFGACDFNALSPVQYGGKSEAVKNIQLCLQEMGFKISAATGYYGQETVKAIKAYYSSWYGSWNGLRLGNLGIENIKKMLNSSTSFSLVKFSSAEDYKKYLESSSEISQSYSFGFRVPTIGVTAAPTEEKSSSDSSSNASGTATAAERYSSTNVQVLGIDEPDIAKTNGQTIFYKTYQYQTYSCPEGAMCKMIAPAGSNKISLIKALPIDQLSVDSKIDVTGYNSGELLLNKNILIVLESNKVKGYDVSNTKEPKEKWTVELDENNRVVDSRLYDGKLYLVTSAYTNSYKTCPINILKSGNNSLIAKCIDIYHPSTVMAVDSNYAVMSINPDDGSVLNSFSFLGSSSSSIIYMSEDNLYITYNYYEDQLKYYLNFIKEKATDLFPNTLIAKLEKVSNYDISNSSKWTELQTELNKYYNSLSSDENLRISNEFNNRLNDYSKIHYRELEKTAIIKIGLNDLKIISTTAVPGRLLNQFALDEYNGNLRVAVTIGGNWNMFGGREESVNEVYVLDGKLNTLGSITNLGITERIYSARFIGNRGYLVTFKQTDPFYVLDLSVPNSPSVKGELKIPGYSAYLHPIADNIILGIGRENSQVKLSLFDVTSPENPVEISKYNLNDYWTEIESNHRAFLLDQSHNIFFIPASQGGYVFSYKGNKLSLIKTVQDYNIKRAIYINDYLYMLGDSKITVFNENNWEKVKELELK